mgnify:CR=1 FL=1
MHKRLFCRRETTERQEQRLGDQLRGYCRRSVERNGARPRVVLVAMERSRWFKRYLGAELMGSELNKDCGMRHPWVPGRWWCVLHHDCEHTGQRLRGEGRGEQ